MKFKPTFIGIVLLSFIAALAAGPAQAGSEAVAWSGAPVSRPFLIADQSVPAIAPAAAYNSQHFEYLVVWENSRTGCSDIYGQRVSKDGTLIGPWFSVVAGCPNRRISPHIAYNSQQDEYLVVWEEIDPGATRSIRGQRISATNQLLGGVINLAIGSSGANYETPAVGFASTPGKYLAVYVRVGTLSYKIAAQGLNSDGSAWGASFDASPTIYRLESPELAYNRLRNEFLLVYEAEPSTSKFTIDAQRITMAGSAGKVGSAFTVASDPTNNESSPIVAAVPRAPDGQYLVAWEYDRKTGDLDVQAQLFSGAGSLEGGLIPVGNSPLEEYLPGAGSSESGMGYLVTYIHSNGSTIYDVSGKTVSTGGVVGPEFWLGGGTAGAYGYEEAPAVAGGPNGDYLMAYGSLGSSTSVFKVWGRLFGNRVYLPQITFNP